METQDHRKPNQSGHEGHGGAHFCHKCGWPFPNPHPSSRHRRAHRRVCGTIEGYKLDSTQEDTHLDDSGGDHRVSDDEFKTPSVKVVEATISRRSNSGVGSRSTRSEDDLFADAVTDFIDSPGVGEASDGIERRENSLQKIPENDPDGTKLAAVNVINDDSSASNIHVNNNELQTVQKLEGQNDKAEGSSMPSQDPNSINNSTMASALFIIENENAVEQQLMQSSTTSNELNLGVEEGNETSSKDLSEIRTTAPEARGSMLEDVSTLRDGIEECQDSVCADGMVKRTGLQTCRFEGNVECSGEVDSPVNNHAPSELAQVIESNGNSRNTGKSTDMIEEPDTKFNSNENMHVVVAPDALHVLVHPEIAVEDFDHNRGKFNVFMGPDASLAFESIAFGEDPAIEESCFGNDFAKSGESSDIRSQHHVVETVHFTKDMLKPDVGQSRSIVLQHTGGEANQISDAEACNTDIGEFKGKEVSEDIKSETCKKESSGSEEQKHNISLDNVSLEDAVVDRCVNQETRSTAVFIDDEHFVVNENGRNQVQVEELAATSLQLAESALAKEAIYSYDANDNDHGKIRVEGTALNANERIGGEDEGKALVAEVRPAYGSNLPGSHESNVEAFEPERKYELQTLDSGNAMGGHSQLKSQSTSRGVREIQSTDDHMGGEECIKDDTGGIVEDDDHLDLPLKMTQIDVSEMLENAGSSFPRSTAIRDSCSVEMAENASLAVEADGTTKEHFAVSAVDTPVDSSSQSDSLEGNWGSVSVLSAISDAPLATDTAASNTSQASAEAVTAIMVPEVPETGQHSESKTSVEPQVAGLKQKEGTSEILTSQIEQRKSSALQSDWSPLVTPISNDQLADQRNEEIIAKVAKWNTEKQHTPLKILLGEATARSRAESPCHDFNPLPDCQKEEIPLTNNGLSPKRQNVVRGTKEAAKEEIGKEWNSPARYPVNIKTEKRRAKNKPYWALFVCCSSVDAAR